MAFDDELTHDEDENEEDLGKFGMHVEGEEDDADPSVDLEDDDEEEKSHDFDTGEPEEESY